MTTQSVLLKAREALHSTQYGFPHRRCPVCAGWNVGPNGETDRAHTPTCPVAEAIADLDRAIAEGYVLVPSMPTPEMIRAGDDSGFASYTGTWVLIPSDCYAAMLRAIQPIATENTSPSGVEETP